jgi:signal transduction histidine kinase
MVYVEHVNTPLIENGAVAGAVVVFRDISERKRDEEEIRKLNVELEQRVITRTADLEKKSLELKDSQLALMNIVDDLNNKTVELAEANIKLQDLDRLKSMFVASMSHELRTPLNSIIGFSSVVLEEWLGPLNDEQKAKLAIVLRTGRHLLTLINDVIDVSKIEAGKLESRVEDFELRQVVGEALELVRKDGEEKGLVFRDATTAQTLHSDRRRFFQCLVNLLGNAVKFSQQGEVVVASALVPGVGGGPDCLRISVRDGGIGIPEAELPRLFTAFTRIQSELSGTVKGTGLGLYLVKKITTEILRGQVEVESTAGQGSTFYLTVPLRIEERSPVDRVAV